MALGRRRARVDTIGSLGDMEYLASSGLWVPVGGTRATGKVPTVKSDGTIEWQVPSMGTAAEVRIDRQTPSGTGTVTFSSLGSYSDLRVVVVGRGAAAATSVNVTVRLNNDSTAIYDYERFEYNNATNFSTGFVAQTSWQIGYLTGANAASGVASVAEARIYDYLGTTFNKTMLAAGGLNNATGTPATSNLFADRFWGQYRSTSAITRVDVILSAGNFASGCVVSLYGIL